MEGYKGHFDGQNHTISGLEYTTNKNYHGLFGVLLDGAVVENFSVYGNITNVSYDAFESWLTGTQAESLGDP